MGTRLAFRLMLCACALGVGCAGSRRVLNPDARLDDGKTPNRDALPWQLGDSADTTPDFTLPTRTALQLVTNSLKLPKTGGAYAVDLDKDGKKDNQLGAILAALGALSGTLDLQGSIDRSLNEARTILLFELKADALKASLLQITMHLGTDLDQDPTDNFSGKEHFGLSSSSPTGIRLLGDIDNTGQLSARGELLVALTIGPTPQIFALKGAQISAKVDKGGLHQGVMAGAIPFTDVTSKLMPLIADALNKEYTDPTSDPKLVTQLRDLFDADKNGAISPTEVSNNALVKALIKPDVDIDGDGKDDGLSLGFGFTAVPCTF